MYVCNTYVCMYMSVRTYTRVWLCVRYTHLSLKEKNVRAGWKHVRVRNAISVRVCMYESRLNVWVSTRMPSWVRLCILLVMWDGVLLFSSAIKPAMPACLCILCAWMLCMHVCCTYVNEYDACIHICIYICAISCSIGNISVLFVCTYAWFMCEFMCMHVCTIFCKIKPISLYNACAISCLNTSKLKLKGITEHRHKAAVCKNIGTKTVRLQEHRHKDSPFART